LLEHIHFSSGLAEAPLLAALDYLRRAASLAQGTEEAPLDVVPPKWRRHVGDGRSAIEQRAYTFCVLDQLRTALKRRDVFVNPSWRYADPRSALLAGAECGLPESLCRPISLSHPNRHGPRAKPDIRLGDS